IWRAGLRPSRVADFLGFLADSRKDLATPSLQVSAVDGLIRAFENASTDSNFLAGQLDSLRRHATKLGGSLIVETAPPELKNKTCGWGDLGQGGELMASNKKQLDPGGPLSPERF